MINAPRINAPWLLEDHVLKLVEALGRDNIRFVGGAVRDTLLGRAIKDVDVATLLPPEDVFRRLEAAKIKAVPTGLAHGTITAVVNGRPFEVTTLRHDVKTHGRHADVAFHDNWEDDAARRDFTMNAMYLSVDGRLYDYYEGRDDLEAGRVRFIGDAAQRIEEDALRVLRFFRFHALYGQGPMDQDGLKACEKSINLLDHLSVERVRGELMKMLAAVDPVPVFKAMMEGGILGHVLPECASLSRLENLVAAEKEGGAEQHPLRRMVTLTPSRHGEVRALAQRLKFSNDERNILESLVHVDPRVAPGMSEHELHEALYRFGMDSFIDFAWLNADKVSAVVVPALISHAASWRIPAMPVSGKDLLALGVAPGVALGELLCVMEEAWIKSDFTMSREVLLQQFMDE